MSVESSPDPPGPKYLTATEAARVIGCSVSLVQKEATAGKLRGRKLSDKKRSPWRFTRDDVQAYMNRLTIGTTETPAGGQT